MINLPVLLNRAETASHLFPLCAPLYALGLCVLDVILRVVEVFYGGPCVSRQSRFRGADDLSTPKSGQHKLKTTVRRVNSV